MTIIDVSHDERLERVVVPPETPILEGLQQLDRGGLGVLLIADEANKLSGLVTDGDVRRSILQGDLLTGTCERIANTSPTVAPAGLSGAEMLQAMDHARSFPLNHLPIVDDSGCLVGLVLRSDLVAPDELLLSAVVMAGGFGKRLHPLTANTPKPMLPVGARPLIEDIVHQLRLAGIHRVSISTHFEPDKIKQHLGDGTDFGVEIQYVTEDLPLGTAGALGLLKGRDEPLLVVNGDILTRVDFRAMLRFHRKHNALFTIGARRYEFEVPYGVIDAQGPLVRAIKEKPRLDFLVNAGIYLLEPQVLDFITPDEHLDMDELIALLIAEQQTVVSFPVVEYWLDIGRPGDYEQAQADVQNGRLAQ